ncbi:hypothetical protein J672_2031 [Acinetobacter sp. 883425]|nr:hypothetical protein J551_1785 [Acinetobacter sp. 1475718]EXS15558.1 hypothetical protein J672_2031 [Acinetobacter sp. 883425]
MNAYVRTYNSIWTIGLQVQKRKKYVTRAIGIALVTWTEVIWEE